MPEVVELAPDQPGRRGAAASLLTVTRTSSLPAWASAATWSAVASASAVSVFVIDWTTIGAAEPTSTPPTSTSDGRPPPARAGCAHAAEAADVRAR